MLKKGIKNYFSCLKYFFTPLGTMFLGIMLGVSILVPSVINSANRLGENITQLSQNVNLDFTVLWNDLWTAVRSLNWYEPATAVKTLISPEWINGVLTQTLADVLGTDFETFKMQIAQFVSGFCNDIADGTAAFLVCWFLGFFAGMALTRFLIRRNIAKRSIWKFILAYFINSLLATALAIGTLIVFSLWAYSIIFAIILMLLLSGVAAFVQAYLLYAYKKLPFNQIVNVKNAGLLILSNLIIFSVSIVITLIALAINALVGLFAGLSLFVITAAVINLNAESFVLEQVKNLSACNDGTGEIVTCETSDSEEIIDEIK